MDLGLTGRVALVTGGTRGIGRADCDALVEEGAFVALCARDAGECAGVAAELGGAAAGFACDVAAPGAATELVADVTQRFGRLDAVVNNAGRFGGGPSVEATEEDFVAGFDTKMLGALRLVRTALPHLRESDQARVVNASGISANKMLTGAVVTAVANAGMLALTAYLARELIDDGINVCGIVPGYVLTPPWRKRTEAVVAAEGISFDEALQVVLDREALGHARWGEPREIADVVAFLLSRQASFMNGTVMRVDGGQFASVRY